MLLTIHRLPGFLTIRHEVELQIDDLRKLKLQPTLVRLSSKASVQFAYEDGDKDGRIANAPKLFWGPGCLCYIVYRDPFVRWTWVEGIPKTLFSRLVREGYSVLNLFYGV